LNKTKELLSQGLPKNALDKDDRRKLIPYHMHINADLVDTVHLIVSMLLEIPNIILEPYQ